MNEIIVFFIRISNFFSRVRKISCITLKQFSFRLLKALVSSSLPSQTAPPSTLLISNLFVCLLPHPLNSVVVYSLNVLASTLEHKHACACMYPCTRVHGALSCVLRRFALCASLLLITKIPRCLVSPWLLVGRISISQENTL